MGLPFMQLARCGCSIPFIVSMPTMLFPRSLDGSRLLLRRGRCCEAQRRHTGKLGNFHQAGQIYITQSDRHAL